MPFNFLNQGQSDDNATRFQPIDTFIDPVSKIRVSNPGNLIDTDFEYGLQPTKWETVEIINNTPAFFSKSGDTTISDITGVTTNAGTREITVTTAFPHLLDVGIPIRVAGTKSLTADGSYIINATPTPTTFTYLSRANQPETVSIFDLYTSIITGEFFQGSQISVSDSEGITTDGAGPNSTLTVKTSNKHGFGPNTPFYFLNLNSTVSQEFESQNSTSLSFDPTNSATAQTFDGSNTLLQTPVDLSNSATTSLYENNITSTDPSNSTVTVSINQNDANNWSELKYGSPLYYSVNIGSGYFQANPKGVIFIKDVSGVDAESLTATFEVSEVPEGSSLPVLANMTGYFQIADQATTFAGNNVDPSTQIDLTLQQETPIEFDGGNQGYVGIQDNPPSNVGTVVGYTGTNVTVFTSEGSLDYYEGAMLSYSSTGDDATGLSSGNTYFVTSFSEGASNGLFNITISELPVGQGQTPNNISVSGGSGTQTFSKIGVSVDKDIIHVKDSSFEEGDMLEYSFPGENIADRFQVGDVDQQKLFYFVEVAYDTHNYKLTEKVGYKPMKATGGTITTIFDANENRLYNIHNFRTVGSDNFTVTELGDVANGGDQVDVLIVAGGGSGGGNLAGGGGAGGMIEQTITVSPSTYPITIGNGGARVQGYQGGARGNVGGNSVAFGLTALGGGGGGAGTQNKSGGNGGSGGGASGYSSRTSGGTGLQPGSASGGFGNNGGSAGTGGNYPGGGGGGAGAAGQTITSSSQRGGDGGNGRQTDFFGESLYFAGGGGGGSYTGSNGGGNGGLGGGGGGGANTGTPGSGGTGGLNDGGRGSNAGYPGTGVRTGGDAGANTGSGGGGTGHQQHVSGQGGSGIVAVRYPISDVLSGDAFGGSIDASGGDLVEDIFVSAGTQFTPYRVHTFLTTGTSTFNVASTGTFTDSDKVEYLVVAGGASGGGNLAGGGGAGGFVTNEGSPLTVSATSYSVVVGTGGARTSSSQGGTAGISGGNSSVFGITAIGGGGGGGGANGVRANSGGSGGGAGGYGSSSGDPGGTGLQPGSASGGFGNNGGIGGGGGGQNYRAGGGGGANGQGGVSANSGGRGGFGGPGKLSNIDGKGYYYAAGGGGGSYTSNSGGGIGGQGGGGGGGTNSSSGGPGGTGGRNNGLSGVASNSSGASSTPRGGDAGANTGSGGGGPGHQTAQSGAGGSGIVIIRYPLAEPIEVEQ